MNAEQIAQSPFCNLLAELFFSFGLSKDQDVEFSDKWEEVFKPEISEVLKKHLPVKEFFGSSIADIIISIPKDYPEKEFAGLEMIAKILPTMEILRAYDYCIEIEKKFFLGLGSEGFDLLIEFVPEKIPEGKYLLSPKKGKNKISRMFKNGEIKKEDHLVSTEDLIYPGNYFVVFAHNMVD